MRRAWIWGAAAVVLVVTGSVAWAIFKERQEVPLRRLLTNVTEALAKAPDDPHLLYLAGRTHAIAYFQGLDAVGRSGRVWEKNRDGNADLPDFGTRNYDRLVFEGEIDDARLDHLRDGIRLLRRGAEAQAAATKFAASDRPLLFLGLAWLLDDGSRFAPQLGHPEGTETSDDLPAAERTAIDVRIAALGAEKDEDRKAAFDALRASLARCWPRLVASKDAKEPNVRTQVGKLLTRWWQDQALVAYRKAYELSRKWDVEREGNMDGWFTISREAGKAILRLIDAPSDDKAAKAERTAISEHLARLDERGDSITPILFPIPRPAPLADLLPAGRTARFDLAGDGISRLWPWPSADAGFLVWTPPDDRTVASGRRMFGSRTWWIFWRDGYEPLSMLDDDGDGRLAGAELEDLCVWRDADGDGVSDPGEIETVGAHGITWIAVTSTRTENGVPANDLGLGLADGTTRPTYDWTPTSIPEPAASE